MSDDTLQMLKAFGCFPAGGPVNGHCSARELEAWTQPANAGPLVPNGTFLLDLGHVLLKFGLFEGANGSEKRTDSGRQQSHVDWHSARGAIDGAGPEIRPRF